MRLMLTFKFFILKFLSLIFLGTYEFLKGVCEHLKISLNHIRQHDSIPKLAFANKKDVMSLYKCYTHLPFYYKRKHDKFLQRINLSCYDKYR